MTERITGWMFVAVQVALIFVLVLLPATDHFPVPWWLRIASDSLFWLGASLAVLAGLFLGRSLTATPVPSAKASLRTAGPYRFVRHPIYTGVVLMVAAIVVRSGNALGVALGLVTLAFFHWKASWEEARLRERFAGYAAYAAATPRFVPRLFTWR